MQSIRVIKLTSGETIVGKMSIRERSPFVQIDDPVQFTMMYKGHGGEGTLVAQQWLETEETSFSIHKQQIVAHAEPNEMLKDYYHHSLTDLSEPYEDAVDTDLLDLDDITIH